MNNLKICNGNVMVQYLKGEIDENYKAYAHFTCNDCKLDCHQRQNLQLKWVLWDAQGWDELKKIGTKSLCNDTVCDHKNGNFTIDKPVSGKEVMCFKCLDCNTHVKFERSIGWIYNGEWIKISNKNCLI